MSDANDYIRSTCKSVNSSKGNGKIKNCISIISSVFNGGLKANIQSTYNSEDKNMKLIYPYGFTSFPYKGMKAQVIYNDGGNTIVGVYDESKPQAELGDVIMYNKSGSTVKIDKNGNIFIDSTSNITITGSISIVGSLNLNGNPIV